MSIYKQEFVLDAAFKGPIDLYIVKRAENLYAVQVNSADVKIDRLESNKELCTIPDYIRLSVKHTFVQSIHISCVADLALADGDVCGLAEFPKVLREFLDIFEKRLETCYNKL